MPKNAWPRHVAVGQMHTRCTHKKLNFQAVIKSAASTASPIAWGEPRSRRPPAEAVGLKVELFQKSGQPFSAIFGRASGQI